MKEDLIEQFKDRILIPDPESFCRKLETFKTGGAESLHIVSDFNRTLTPSMLDGQPVTASWIMFRSLLPEGYVRQRDALYERYNPIERDPEASLEYKQSQMDQWWRAHLDLLISEGIDAGLFRQALERKHLCLRPGAAGFLKAAADADIPFLILSAGLGDAILMHLEEEGALHDNMHISSNFFEFDSLGKASGFKEPVIHTFNKTGKAAGSTIVSRPNIFLLGDTEIDARMTEGLPHEESIKIGFLNGNEDQTLRDRFAKAFDVIILSDEGMDLPQALIESIISSAERLS